MSPRTRVNELWNTCECVMAHKSMSPALPHIERVMAYIYTSHGTHMTKSWHTYTYPNIIIRIYITDPEYISICNMLSVCMPWLGHMCAVTHLRVSNNALKRVQRLQTSSSVYMLQLLCAWVYATCVKKKWRLKRPLHYWIIPHLKRTLHKLDVNVHVRSKRTFQTHVLNARSKRTLHILCLHRSFLIAHST